MPIKIEITTPKSETAVRPRLMTTSFSIPTEIWPTRMAATGHEHRESDEVVEHTVANGLSKRIQRDREDTIHGCSFHGESFTDAPRQRLSPVAIY